MPRWIVFDGNSLMQAVALIAAIVAVESAARWALGRLRRGAERAERRLDRSLLESVRRDVLDGFGELTDLVSAAARAAARRHEEVVRLAARVSAAARAAARRHEEVVRLAARVEEVARQLEAKDPARAEPAGPWKPKAGDRVRSYRGIPGRVEEIYTSRATGTTMARVRFDDGFRTDVAAAALEPAEEARS
jgi:uncharacterized membrane protein YccC